MPRAIDIDLTMSSEETQPEKSPELAESSKFKFIVQKGPQFKLFRRNTEESFRKKIRPSPEEAAKWAVSFNNLMASRYGQSLFKAFLTREFSDENIEFWLAVEEYKKSKENKLVSKANQLLSQFILLKSPKEINLDSATRTALIKKVTGGSANPAHFDQVQKSIQSLLEADAYSRFLESDLYLELMHPERYIDNDEPE